jgi:hypothetical protein
MMMINEMNDDEEIQKILVFPAAEIPAATARPPKTPCGHGQLRPVAAT